MLMYAAMAGNVIPAIATTNAVIAGLIVMEALINVISYVICMYANVC